MVEPATRHLELTAVYRKVAEGYIGLIEELPGANTQGRTLDEARSNLREAAALVLNANRTLAMQGVDQDSAIREPCGSRPARRRNLVIPRPKKS
jgi:predicted RNase H-like HicB family nuclease